MEDGNVLVEPNVPNPRLQHPEKFQTSNSKNTPAPKIGAWLLVLLWSLAVGAWSFRQRGFEAGVHHPLRFQRPQRPVVAELAGENLVRKIAEHERVLRGGVALQPGFGSRRTFCPGNTMLRVVDLERRFVAVERMDETRHAQPAFLPADVHPLLPGGEEGTIKSGGNAAVINQF